MASEIQGAISLIERELSCIVCYSLFTDAQRTSCGHVFCGDCIVQLLKSDLNTLHIPQCPLCKNLLTKRSLRRDLLIEDLSVCLKELKRAFRRDSVQELSQISQSLNSADNDLNTLEDIRFKINSEIQLIDREIGSLGRKTLTASSLTDGQMQVLEEFCERNNFELQREITAKTDYLITDGIRCKRTFKYLYALHTDCVIVSFAWINASIDSSRLLDTGEYLVKSDSKSLANGLEDIQTKLKQRKVKLFNEKNFFLYGEFSERKRSELTKLISVGGGNLMASLERVAESSKKVYILCDKTQNAFEVGAEILKKHVPILLCDWLTESIACGELRKAKEYVAL